MKPEISTLDRMRSRPRFKVYTKLSPENYAENLKKYIVENQKEFGGNINKAIATISVKTEEDFYYKPYLSLRTELEDGKTVVRGVFGPSSEIWTLFVFIYALLAFSWGSLLVLWFVGNQIKIEDYTWCLPVSFGVLSLMAINYTAAKFGQNKAKREMAQLRRFAIESTLPHELEEEEEEDAVLN